MKEGFNLSYYRETAAVAAQQYAAVGNKYLKDLYHGDYQHIAFELRVNLKAPYIALPLHPADPTDSSALFFDFGNIIVCIPHIYIVYSVYI